MNKNFLISVIIFIGIYLLIISIAASVCAIVDKKRAMNGKWRIPESTLMLLGLFGGALAEYITMKKIRHKTKHMKFMIGLPIEIFFHLVIVVISIIKVASI